MAAIQGIYSKSIPTQGINDMFAVDNLNCWIVGHNWESSSAFTLNTSNGGVEWELKPAEGFSLNSIFFIDNNHGWVAGDSGANYIRKMVGNIGKIR